MNMKKMALLVLSLLLVGALLAGCQAQDGGLQAEASALFGTAQTALDKVADAASNASDSVKADLAKVGEELSEIGSRIEDSNAAKITQAQWEELKGQLAGIIGRIGDLGETAGEAVRDAFDTLAGKAEDALATTKEKVAQGGDTARAEYEKLEEELDALQERIKQSEAGQWTAEQAQKLQDELEALLEKAEDLGKRAE